MCVHVFGAVSSSTCANFALRKTADDNEVMFSTPVADVLRNNFYVDDLLVSEKDVGAAVNLMLV